MLFTSPAYNCTFIVDNVNRRWGRYDDQVTVGYTTEDGEEGEMTMTGSELRSINKWVWGRKRDDWNINLFDVIGETGVTKLTVTLANALGESRRARTSKIFLRAVKYCGNETENFKPRKLGD
jgi:hypothetical protein